MGEVIDFNRTKLAEAISEQAPVPINDAEAITDDKFPTWGQLDDIAPSEYSAPDSDGA
jgi:hypothetical protein